MDDLVEALTELRATLTALGLPWHPPPAREQVEADLAKFHVRAPEELLTWYSFVGPGTWVTPQALVCSLAREADGYDDMCAIATGDHWEPDDLSQVVDWFFLSHIEVGGPALWIGECDAPRPVVWRDELWETHPETRYDRGLTALVHDWIDAWRTGLYLPGPPGRFPRRAGTDWATCRVL